MIWSVMIAVWWAALAITCAAVAYLVLSLLAVALWRPNQGQSWPVPPDVTLLKPLCGLEDGLEEAITSFLQQSTSSQVDYVFGVAAESDPALALARTVSARYPQVSCRFVVDQALHGPNPKVSNLINMAKGGLCELVALSDSDIVMGPGDLQRAIDAVNAPGLGAVTALYRARPGRPSDKMRSFGGWFLDYWFLPMALLHARLAPLSVTYGPLTIIRRDVLDQVGGIAALADHLSDDAELGRLVRTAGYSIAFTPDVLETLVNDSNHAELFAHELRWSRTVRGLDPLGFFASVVSHPGPLPLLLLLRPGVIAVIGILLPIILRWVMAMSIERRFGRSQTQLRPGLIGLWLRDCYCFAVWAAACRARQVGWRGQQLSVHHGDILKPVVDQS